MLFQINTIHHLLPKLSSWGDHFQCDIGSCVTRFHDGFSECRVNSLSVIQA